ncbi:uncharacterized protein TNCV_2730151 [Trichonephila clavipes]|nr:uncharacterized protein TNCV_2730151 [Trichonephila clavipes]
MGRGSTVVKVSDHGSHVVSSNRVRLNTRLVRERYPLNLSRAQKSSCWFGVVVRRGGWHLRCPSRHLTMVQNYDIRRKKSSCC